MKQIAKIEQTELDVMFTNDTVMADVIERIQKAAFSVVTTADTPKGRAEIKSLAYKIARTKTAGDDAGKLLVADIKKTAKAIDSKRKVFRDALDDIKQEVRAPLTEWEAAEKEFHDSVAGTLDWMHDLKTRVASEAGERFTAVDFDQRIVQLENFDLGQVFGEYEARIVKEYAETQFALYRFKDEAEQYESEMAELAELRKLKALQEKHEYDIALVEKAKADAAAELQAVAQPDPDELSSIRAMKAVEDLATHGVGYSEAHEIVRLVIAGKIRNIRFY